MKWGNRIIAKQQNPILSGLIYQSCIWEMENSQIFVGRRNEEKENPIELTKTKVKVPSRSKLRQTRVAVLRTGIEDVDEHMMSY